MQLVDSGRYVYFQREIAQKTRSSVSGGTTVDRSSRKSVATANSGVEDKYVRNARKKIEATQVEDLAFIGSTMSEMATFLNCSEYTLYRRFHKVIMRAIVCRTIFLKRQRFELALKGNVAALKFWDAGVDETNKQLKDLKRHAEEASLTHEERNARILDSVKRIQEFWDKYPEMKKSIWPSAAA